VAREGNRVRLFTRNGHDWTGRYPWIVDEGIMVSKRADRPYRADRSKDWVKVKNRKHDRGPIRSHARVYSQALLRPKQSTR
jgi:ATP-dependent DNA ligase